MVSQNVLLLAFETCNKIPSGMVITVERDAEALKTHVEIHHKMSIDRHDCHRLTRIFLKKYL